MVAAFLDGWMTGDQDEDSVTMEFDRPSRREVVSVAGLAARLYLGGVGTPRRYFAWGQAVRNAVLGVMLAHAVWGLSQLVLFARSRHLIGWLPPAAGRLLAHDGVRGRLRLDRGLRGAGPDGLPHRPRHRGPRYRRRPRDRAARAAGRRPGVALCVVDLLGRTRPRPGPGDGRVPPGRPAGRPPTLAAGAARLVPAGVPAPAGGRAVRPRCLGARHLRAVLHPGRCPLPGPRGESPVRPGGRGRVVAEPGAAGRRSRPVPDQLAHPLPARSPPDQGRPGGTARPGDRRRAGCP